MREELEKIRQEALALIEAADTPQALDQARAAVLGRRGSLKQITYVKEQIPEAQVYMYYIDVRALGYLEDFVRRVQAMDGVTLTKGKVAKITEVAGFSMDAGTLVYPFTFTLRDLVHKTVGAKAARG